ncbi:MAG: pyruvate, phosphate dikinase [Nitrospira sp.]|uniref:pyruvate, phosphate dikinase n=1 Tax=Nitrospira sp. ND1 TaxID=1658518 RepID=UPI0009BAE546|nr:pyruvate, phosphate dikinase [Nitrospira sp. ND1]MBK7419761.1 pyruvate, phosphate dikinase [Nitrospira sp.]MBK7486635.1 pyruvate, phosphate dikinase [Nitrospira sp.]MBP6199189.1 pyruvate, phosphate dikinase [Nitrospira sp.]MBP6205544.1 pyruvate, phosphate dikinase [Nitrospira sp.]MBP7361330.1 pyruvate, phosphate dikinase [Nitrospira sp.]
MAKKYVYYFGDGKAEGTGNMKELLGGKGAGLAEMTNLKVSVPPGFTISTEACVEYYKRGKAYPPGMMDEALHALKRIERSMKAGFGDPDNPLLVSVRSGARASMPGMMDTVLNVGLTTKTVHGLALKTKNERFAQDSYRRFIGMFGSIVMGVNREHFEDILKHKKRDLGVTQDTHLDAKALKELVVSFKELVKEETKRDFPDDPLEQLRMAINAVFSSWYGARAVTYRRLYNIPETWGTAVNVVAMVFGNMGETSGTGVAFTRDPATGQRQFFGECLTNAQGEDVVAGIRTPLPVKELEKFMPEAYKDLEATYKKLERHYRDMLDLEFTIQEGKLYMLQTRVGKRTGVAAVRIAVDMVKEGLITKKEALQRIGPDQLAQYLYPIFDAQEESRCTPLGKGLPAGPGAAAGKLALTADRAVEMKAAGNRVVLVRQETSPDDIHGMNAALGFLTARGGMTSHAAVVARQMGKVCVAGCEAIEVLDSQSVRIGTQVFREGEYLSVNGSTGNVYGGDIPVVESEVIQVLQGKMEASASEKYQLFESVLKWADGVRKLKVRANADVPDQARIARSFGAEGIGLCRTEHMFFAEDRIQIMQKMILARKREEREMYLDQLLPLQKQDFIGLYREMKGFPVTIRLLDPPLHEFLPKREDLMVEIAQLELTSGAPTVLEEKKRLLARVEELHEFNPMLGLRGCRLGITMPEITKMQARAIIEAACELAKEGTKIVPEIMIPLVGMVSEMKAQKDLVREVATDTMKRYGVKLSYLVGTMIELPRAAVTADRIAEEAEFFSFGTNDLTQTTFGFSRDDAAKFIDFYKTANILDSDPFAVLDREGVGSLMRAAIVGGRKTRPTIKLGICGEHGGDPSSVEFCHQLGLDYVSCSPYRVGIARLAAAQAALAEAETEKAKPKKVQPSTKRVAKSKPAKKSATHAPVKKRPAAKRVVRRPKRTKR